MKILILKPSSLGDVVQALPVLRLLKRNFPSSEIHWWISQDLQSLLEYDPDLTGIIPFERRGWARPANWKRLMQSVARARAMRFDWVIDLQALARSALFGWLASGRFFIGLDDSREGAPALYDRAVPRPSFHTHAVDWYLEVLKSLGVPVHWDFDWLPVRPEIEASVERRWPRADDRWILLNPGARWPNKRWPAESFAELAVILSRRMPGARFAVLGGSSDVPLAKTISKAVEGRCVDLTGQTSLPELIAWIRRGEVIVTNDTGPMHIAAAMRKPVVALFGPTEPRRTGPYGQIGRVLKTDLPCAPCLRATCHFERPLECMHALRPAMIAERVLQEMNHQ